MHSKVKEYVDRINNGEIIKTINLGRLAIRDSDVQPLLEVFENNPEVAAKVQRLYLYHNHLTSIVIPSTLTALNMLELSYNQLTSIIMPATLPALQYLRLGNNQLTSIRLPANFLAKLFDVNIHYHQSPPIQHLMMHTLLHVDPLFELPMYVEPITSLTTDMINSHFERSRTFAAIIRSINSITLKFLILHQLEYWVRSDISEKTIWTVVPNIREFYSDHFRGLKAAAIDPSLELVALRSAFAIAVHAGQNQSIFADALITLNEFAESDAGKKLIYARKQEFDNFTKDKNAFMLRLQLALKIVSDGSHYILEIREGRMEVMVGAARSPSEAFYRTLLNILCEYGIPDNLFSPKEVLEIIKPLQLTRVATKRLTPKASCS